MLIVRLDPFTVDVDVVPVTFNDPRLVAPLTFNEVINGGLLKSLLTWTTVEEPVEIFSNPCPTEIEAENCVKNKTERPTVPSLISIKLLLPFVVPFVINK